MSSDARRGPRAETHVRTDSINHYSKSLVQPHLRIGQSDLAKQRDDLLNGGREERHKRLAVKIPRIALGEAPCRGESDRSVRGRVAAKEVDEKRVDFGPG